MRERLVPALILMAVAALPLAGARGQTPEPTKLVLGETATREVEQDTLVAVVSARAQADAPREAQQQVNTAMAAAIEKAKGMEGIRPSTGGYRVYQEYGSEGPTGQWIAEQDLRLKSQRVVAMLELVGDLQDDGLLVGDLGYELGPDARRRIEDELTIEAIGALRARAGQIAESMDMGVAGIETVRVGGAMGEPPVRPMFRTTMAAEAAQSAPPVALPDLETVSVTVEAEVALARR
jgi:predicted secreted protein